MKVLVANRGEIARRVVRAARALSLKSVCLYADIDRKSPHLIEADETQRIGEARSYLDFDKVIAAAKASGAELIHPGYGFLSENAEFAKKCEEEKLIFVGPHSSSLELFSNKDNTRELAIQSGVPTIPGIRLNSHDCSSEDLSTLRWPLMIKAACGGGGKGMRLVENPDDFAEALESARRESLTSFNSEKMIVEEAIFAARHIEVQVAGDGENFLHFFDRDCSLQRRHQKIIEFAPASDLDSKLRNELFEHALTLAKAGKLKGLATVEFLVRAESRECFLLEVNPRIQVEHPITEQVCSVDLVKLQLEIALGKTLPYAQDQIKEKNFAVEARICAENPWLNLLPQTGNIEAITLPQETECLRLEHSLAKGLRITSNYDSLLAKLICTGSSLCEAFKRANNSLSETMISGVQTNIPLLKDILGNLSQTNIYPNTQYLECEYQPEMESPKELAAEATAISLASRAMASASKSANPQVNKLQDGPMRTFELLSPEGILNVECQVSSLGKSFCQILANDCKYKVEFQDSLDGEIKLKVNGQDRKVFLKHRPIFDSSSSLTINHIFYSIRNALLTGNLEDKALFSDRILSPIPGITFKVAVSEGDIVEEGETILIIESMKMEHTIPAPTKAKVKRIHTEEGAPVEAGDLLLEFETD